MSKNTVGKAQLRLQKALYLWIEALDYVPSGGELHDLYCEALGLQASMLQAKISQIEFVQGNCQPNLYESRTNERVVAVLDHCEREDTKLADTKLSKGYRSRRDSNYFESVEDHADNLYDSSGRCNDPACCPPDDPIAGSRGSSY